MACCSVTDILPLTGTLWSQGVVLIFLLKSRVNFPFDNEFSALKVWKQERSLLDQSIKRCCNVVSVMQ